VSFGKVFARALASEAWPLPNRPSIGTLTNLMKFQIFEIDIERILFDVHNEAETLLVYLKSSICNPTGAYIVLFLEVIPCISEQQMQFIGKSRVGITAALPFDSLKDIWWERRWIRLDGVCHMEADLVGLLRRTGWTIDLFEFCWIGYGFLSDRSRVVKCYDPGFNWRIGKPRGSPE
jgi:hypothetical protein